MLSEQRVTYVITTRKTFKDSEMHFDEIRLNPLLPEEAKNILVSRVYDKEVRKKLRKTEEIVKLCGFVPLALCVVGSLLLEFLEERLIKNLKEKPLEVLEDDQISVKKAIKTSFDLLEKPEDALVLMSVFPGSFDSDAAEAIVEACANSRTLPISILRSLKNRSLIEQPSSPRYQLHSLIKAFAKNVGTSAPLLAEERKWHVLITCVASQKMPISFGVKTLANSPSTPLMKIDKILSTSFWFTPKEGRTRTLLSWTPVMSFLPVVPRN